MSKVWRQEYLPGLRISRHEGAVAIDSHGHSGERNTPKRVAISGCIRMHPEMAVKLAVKLLELARMEQPDEDDES